MTVFSKDIDVLKYEPILFSRLFFPDQVICGGAGGVISGTGFTVSGENFTAKGIEYGGVIRLKTADGNIEGLFEIVSVDDSESLTVSVLRSDAEQSAVGPGDAEAVEYRISTFRPQAVRVMYELTRYFGIHPGCPNSVFGLEDIFDAEVLKEAAVYALISGIYASLAGARGEEDFWKKSEHYQKLYHKSREKIRLDLDTASDGQIEKSVFGGSLRLVRD